MMDKLAYTLSKGTYITVQQCKEIYTATSGETAGGIVAFVLLCLVSIVTISLIMFIGVKASRMRNYIKHKRLERDYSEWVKSEKDLQI